MFENFEIVALTDNSKYNEMIESLLSNLRIPTTTIKLKNKISVQFPNSQSLEADTLVICLSYQNNEFLC